MLSLTSGGVTIDKPIVTHKAQTLSSHKGCTKSRYPFDAHIKVRSDYVKRSLTGGKEEKEFNH